MIELILELIRKKKLELRRAREAALKVEKYKSPMIGTGIQYRNRIRE